MLVNLARPSARAMPLIQWVQLNRGAELEAVTFKAGMNAAVLVLTPVPGAL